MSWAAGAAFGLAHCVKVFPVIVAPVILMNLPGRARKIKFCVAAGAVLLIAWSPFIFQDPRAIIGRVFGYRSVYGNWGLSFLAQQLPAGEANIGCKRLNTHFRLALGSLFDARIGLDRFMAHELGGAPAQALLSSRFGFPVVSGCLEWIRRAVSGLAGAVGCAVWGGASSAIFFMPLAAFFFFLGFITSGRRAFPGTWPIASTSDTIRCPLYFDHAEMICWFSVLIALGVSWKRIGTAAGWKRLLPFPPLAPEWRMAAGLIATCVLYAIVPPQLPTPKPPGDKDEGAVRFINADADLELSLRLNNLGRYEDSLHAAQEALTLMPDSADARASIATAYAAMGKWKRSE